MRAKAHERASAMTIAKLSDASKQQGLATAIRVLETEARALHELAGFIDDRFVQAVEMIFNAEGRLIVTGMGKSGHIGKKIAATLASTGTPSFFVHPAESSHGDMGMIVRGEGIYPNHYGLLHGFHTFGHTGAGSSMFWVNPELDMTFVLMTAGWMEDTSHILRLQRLGDIVLSSVTDI